MWLPSLTRPGSLASASRLEPRRGASSTSTTVSPLRPLIVTGTISSARRPSSVAAIARSWLRSAHLSRSARVISSSSPISVASSNICLPVNGLRRPSSIIASSALTSPMRKPWRAPGQQVGRLRHRLHAAADRELDVAGAHGLVDHPDGAHARRAHLVDRLGGDLDRDPGVDLRLPARDLALSGLQHRAHHDVLDLRRARRRRVAAPRGSLRRPGAWPEAWRGPRPACRSACGRCSGSRFEACSRVYCAPDGRHCDYGRPDRHGCRHDRRRGLRGRGDRARPRRRAAGAGRLRRGQARPAQARGDARRRAALHRRRARRAVGVRSRARAGRRRGGRRAREGARRPGRSAGRSPTTSPTRTWVGWSRARCWPPTCSASTRADPTTRTDRRR